MKLCDLKFNKNAIIKDIKFTDNIKRRLFDLGFIPGEIISKEFSSFFNNPCCYKIKNMFIAIRNEDASLIEVDYE